MAVVKVSSKGWVVIPAEIRARYHIRPGDQMQVVDYGGQIVLMPAISDPIQRARGFLKGGPSLTKALLESRAEELEREERTLPRPAASVNG